MKIKKLIFIPVCLMLAGCASKSSNDDVVIVPDELIEEAIDENDNLNDYARTNAAYEDYNSKLKELFETDAELLGFPSYSLSRQNGYLLLIKDNNIEDGDVCEFVFSNNNGESTSIKGWFEYSYWESILDDFSGTKQINISDWMLYSDDNERLLSLLNKTKYGINESDALYSVKIIKIGNVIRPGKITYPLSEITLMTPEQEFEYKLSQAIEYDNFKYGNLDCSGLEFSNFSLEHKNVVVDYYIKELIEDNNVQDGDIVELCFSNEDNETTIIKAFVRLYYNMETDTFTNTSTIKELRQIRLISNDVNRLVDLLQRTYLTRHEFLDGKNIDIEPDLKLSIKVIDHLDIPEINNEW